MKSDKLIDAIGEIRTDLIQDAETARRKKRNPKRVFLIAAVLTALLVGTAGAEIQSGVVSNLLAPIYGASQSQIIDDIGVPLDASVTVNGYTVTAEAVIGDRHNISVVCSLQREDGAPLADGLYFEDRGNSFLLGSGGGSGSSKMSEDGTKQYIIESWNSELPLLFRHNATMEFHDLVQETEEGGEPALVAEGTWTLRFNARYRDTTRKVPIEKGLTVTDTEGYSYEIKKVLLSQVGIHMDLIAPNTLKTGGWLMKEFKAALIRQDGTILETRGESKGGGGDDGADTFKAHYDATFEEPIEWEDIRAIQICDTEIPVEFVE